MCPHDCTRCIKLQEIREVDVHREVSLELLHFILIRIVTVGPQRIVRPTKRTAQSGKTGSCHTEVILRVSVCICTDLRISILIQYTHINRIDRCNG